MKIDISDHILNILREKFSEEEIEDTLDRILHNFLLQDKESELQQVFDNLLHKLSLKREDVIAGKRKEFNVNYRKAISYCIMEIGGYNTSQLAKILEVNRTSIIFYIKSIKQQLSFNFRGNNKLFEVYRRVYSATLSIINSIC